MVERVCEQRGLEKCTNNEKCEIWRDVKKNFFTRERRTVGLGILKMEKKIAKNRTCLLRERQRCREETSVADLAKNENKHSYWQYARKKTGK